MYDIKLFSTQFIHLYWSAVNSDSKKSALTFIVLIPASVNRRHIHFCYNTLESVSSPNAGFAVCCNLSQVIKTRFVWLFILLTASIAFGLKLMRKFTFQVPGHTRKSLMKNCSPSLTGAYTVTSFLNSNSCCPIDCCYLCGSTKMDPLFKNIRKVCSTNC